MGSHTWESNQLRTQSDMDWYTKLDNSGPYEVRSEMMFPQFWTQSNIDWAMKLDNSVSYEVRSQMEWLVYCIGLEIGFHPKPTKWLFPPYYD
ncbi:unnamed protein product [Prunus brigantina]